MAVTNTTAVQELYNTFAAKETDKADKTDKAGKKTSIYGKTVGEPELSKEAQKYYEGLKKKYGNMDFILVSKDQKANAQANAAKYANPHKTVVLIDEEKIEKMATDEKFREKYEGIIRDSATGLSQMKSQMASSGADVKGFGMQVNDDGTTSYFAVLKKSSADQKARIEKKAAEKKEAKKTEAKKAAKKELEERIQKSHDKNSKVDKFDDEDTVTIKASSLEELMQKIGDFAMEERSNSVQTDNEKMVGQHIDFRG